MPQNLIHMASTSEIGHAKNLASFQSLIVCVRDYGASYTTNNPDLQLPQLEALLVEAQNALSALIIKRSNYDISVNNRQNVFSGLKKLSTRIMSALQIARADKRLIDDAKSYHRKMHGRRAKTKVNMEEQVTTAIPNRYSVSQQSYIQLVQHFEGLISILNHVPIYNPSSPDLQLSNLNAMKMELDLKTQAVVATESQLINARILRDNILYKRQNALVEIGNAVKLEIRTLFGHNSEEFNKIKKISFKRYKG